MTLAGPLFPPAASTSAHAVDHLFAYLITVSALIVLTVFGLLIYLPVRYRRTQQHKKGQTVVPSNLVETGFIGLLFVIAMAMFVWGGWIYFWMAAPPSDCLQINVVAKQWMWKFQHPGGQREINELHVPADRDVQLVMVTEDVIHSLYVPAFRLKGDVVPGRYRTIWFRATRPGVYHLFCAEYCGTNHSGMGGWVTVLPPDRYAAWLETGQVTGSLASNGQQLFLQLGCPTCHREDEQGRAPVLMGLYGKRVQLDDGQVVVADEQYLRDSILNPGGQIVAGFQNIMPTFQGLLTEEQLLLLIDYIKSLGANPPNAAPLPGGAPPGALAPQNQATGTALPGKPAAERSNPAGSTPPRLVPIPTVPGQNKSETP